MTAEEFKTNIQDALQAFAKGSLTKNSLELFSKLGYDTERRAPPGKLAFEEFQCLLLVLIYGLPRKYQFYD